MNENDAQSGRGQERQRPEGRPSIVGDRTQLYYSPAVNLKGVLPDSFAKMSVVPERSFVQGLTICGGEVNVEEHRREVVEVINDLVEAKKKLAGITEDPQLVSLIALRESMASAGLDTLGADEKIQAIKDKTANEVQELQGLIVEFETALAHLWISTAAMWIVDSGHQGRLTLILAEPRNCRGEKFLRVNELSLPSDKVRFDLTAMSPIHPLRQDDGRAFMKGFMTQTGQVVFLTVTGREYSYKAGRELNYTATQKYCLFAGEHSPCYQLLIEVHGQQFKYRAVEFQPDLTQVFGNLSFAEGSIAAKLVASLQKSATKAQSVAQREQAPVVEVDAEVPVEVPAGDSGAKADKPRKRQAK